MKLKATEKSESQFDVLPARYYRGRLLGIEEYHSDYYDQDRWSWKFEITEPELKGRWVWGKTGQSMGFTSTGEPTKARRWTNACLGRELQNLEEVEEEQLKEREVLLDVQQYTDNKGNLANKVVEVIDPDKFQQKMAGVLGSTVPVVAPVASEPSRVGAPLPGSEALGYPRRWTKALGECKELYGWDEGAIIEQKRGLIPDEKLETPFGKLHKEEQRTLVEAFEKWADGDDLPF